MSFAYELKNNTYSFNQKSAHSAIVSSIGEITGSSIILSVFSERKQGLRELYSKTVSLLDLEDVLCSKTRMKLLKLLFNLGQLNTSDLSHKLGANYATTLRHLSLLKTENIVMERLSGKTRFFRFNNSPRAKAMMKLLEEWEH